MEAAAIIAKTDPPVQWRMVVIGEGEEYPRLQAAITRAGLENSVSLVGFLPDAGRMASAFDIFVLPSLKEGLPYAIMEAMVAGAPVIASQVGGIPDLIRDRKSGILVPPGDPQALAGAIMELMAHPGTRRVLADTARQRIRNEFTVAEMVRQTVGLYTNA